MEAEIQRLEWLWQQETEFSDRHSGVEHAHADIQMILQNKGLDSDTLDVFDQMQLQNVITLCRQHKNMAEAGRALFNISRNARATPNDSDRLRKYLARFGLSWADIAS